MYIYIYLHNTQLYTYTRHCTCIYTSVYIAFFEVEGPCLMLWRMDLASAHRIAQCPLNAINLSLSIYLTNKNVDLAIRSGQQKPSEMRI